MWLRFTTHPLNASWGWAVVLRVGQKSNFPSLQLEAIQFGPVVLRRLLSARFLNCFIFVSLDWLDWSDIVNLRWLPTCKRLISACVDTNYNWLFKLFWLLSSIEQYSQVTHYLSSKVLENWSWELLNLSGSSAWSGYVLFWNEALGLWKQHRKPSFLGRITLE